MTFSSAVVTAGFSKFAGILSAEIMFFGIYPRELETDVHT